MELQKVTACAAELTEAAITKEAYLNNVKQRLSANFELEENGTECGETFDLIARYFEVLGRIFITPKDIIDRMETFERVYVKCFDEISEAEVQEFFEKLCTMVMEMQPGKDHFQTDITGVMVCARMPEDIGRLTKKLRFDRLFRMYFRGWCEVRLVCVDLSDGRVCTNPPGKELKKVYELKKKNGSPCIGCV